MKVVVVEDDPEVRDLETFVLESEGYSVVGEPHGETAAECVKREHPDLVLLDLLLPGKDGNAVLADLERDPATAEVPVIVISAFPSRLRRSPQVRRVVLKPFEISELIDAVADETTGATGAGDAAPT